jgi:hypothetical protein
MWRNSFTVFLAYAVLLFSIGPTAYGQYPAAPDSAQAYPDQRYPAQQYPAQQYPQSYPQNQPYGGVPYPQAGQQSQDPNAGQNMGSDEQHGVARLSVVQGDVNVRRGDNGDLVAAVTNAPIMAQDHLQTSPGSRAEVELDYGNLIRLAPNTEVGFAELEYHQYQLQLAAGAIIYRVLRDSEAQAEIDTPSIALRPEGQGEYRISVLNDGTTEISVRSGQVEIFSPHGSEQLAAGRTVLVRGNPADPEFQPAYEAPRDQLDDWSATRDRELMASQSYRYVSPDINGAQDLDAYGNWVPSQYGQVWEPSDTSAEWSPYSDGQWSWQPYYGWTWVDAAPWGWAPYHYGRWFWNGGHRWCWWPGSIGPRYLWSPALVGFFGVGAALGWVALAPFELFHPWWGSGFGRGGYGFGGYGRGNFGMVRGANIAGMYRNAAIRGGAMTASYNSFGGLRQHFSPATRGQLSGANLFRGQLPVSPTRASYRFSQRSAIANPRLASAANRQFFSHRSFGYGAVGTQRATGFARTGGSNMQSSYGRSNGYAAPARNSSTSGWQRFGDPGRSSGVSQGFTGAQEQSGWHHFGEARQATPSYSSGRSNGSMSSYSSPRYQAPQQRQSFSGYGAASGGRFNYSAPSAQHYRAPSQPHYSAPSSRGGGGGGGGGSRGGGGGGHSSSGGHRGR